MKLETKYLKCPYCKTGVLYEDYDGYERYAVCIMCAREFELDGSPRIDKQLVLC